MNYTEKNGLGSVGKLDAPIAKLILSNAKLFDSLLKNEAKFSGFGRLAPQFKVKRMDEIVSEYNTAISPEEITAWVWYKRSLGVPMKGWEKYFIGGSTKTEVVITTGVAKVYSNSYQELREVGPGVTLGKYIRTQDQAQRGKFLIFRSDGGIEMVALSHAKIENTTNGNDVTIINKLVKAGALFYLDGEFLPFPIYTYGNIYERINQLEIDKDFILKTFGSAIYEKHKQALQDAKPALLSVSNPDPTLRPIIAAISDLAEDVERFSIQTIKDDYLKDVEDVEDLTKRNGKVEKQKRDKRINIDFNGKNAYSLQYVFMKWLYTLNEDEDFEKSSAIDVNEYYLKGTPLRNDDLSAEEKNEIKAYARNEGELLFSRFLHEVLTHEDQQRLDYLWNRIYNGFSNLNYHRVPVGFEISTMFKSGLLKISDAQREGVAFMQAVGSGLIAYDVGVGKTMTAIVNLANELMQGKTKRPIIVVPKTTYKKWIAEIVGYTDPKTGNEVYGVLSNTGITVNAWFNLGTNIISKINLNKPVPEKSITIVTYEGFKRLGFSDTVFDTLLDSLTKILEYGDPGTPRDAEKRAQKYREMLGVGLKNTVADIDKLGLDYIVIDEAHRCKNVFNEVRDDDKDGKKRYSMQGSQSETGIKSFLICNYLQRKYGRSTMLLTATPFTNSPLEIYSMMSLVGYDYMLKNGILNIKQFFDLFVKPTYEFVANYKEEMVQREVIKSFTNRVVLQKLIYNHINYKTGDEAKVKRPCKINLPRINSVENGRLKRLSKNDQVLTYLQMNEMQRANQVQIVAAAQENKSNMADIFRALNNSLDNALSPYLYSTMGYELDYKTFVDDSPKIKYACEAIRTVKEWHESRGQTCSGQIIYSNRGKAFFEFIQQYLIQEVGFNPSVDFKTMDDSGREKTYKISQVEIITSEISEAKKEMIKDAFLKGIVKVIIGTATIREGIDLQKRGTVIYNLYPEWNPTDLRQLEGRIWRQGNEFGYVRIAMPLVQDSMDIFVFQKLEEKTYRINDLWDRSDRGNVLDLESLDPSEVKLALITDVSRIVKLLFDEEKAKLNKDLKRAKNALEALKKAKTEISNYIYYKDQVVTMIGDYRNALSNYIKRYSDIATDSGTKKLLKDAQDVLEVIDAFKAKTAYEDADLTSTMRKIEWNNSKFGNLSWKTYIGNNYKEYLSTVKKLERTYLKPKKLNLNSDLQQVIDLYTKDIESFEALAKNYMLDENGVATKELSKTVRWIALLAEVRYKKSALGVEGKSVEGRVAEFDKLNYLLAFTADEKEEQNDSCFIPKPKKEEPQSELEIQFELELLEREIDLLLLSQHG